MIANEIHLGEGGKLNYTQSTDFSALQLQPVQGKIAITWMETMKRPDNKVIA